MAWWIWLIIGLAIGVIELASTTFVLLWLSIAALITTLISVVTLNIWTQFIAFAVISIVLYLATRPLARKWRARRTYPDRNVKMIGKTGVVVREAVPGAFATVRVEGELWSAESDSPLRPGSEVRVIGSKAAVLVVEPIPASD